MTSEAEDYRSWFVMEKLGRLRCELTDISPPQLTQYMQEWERTQRRIRETEEEAITKARQEAKRNANRT